MATEVTCGQCHGRLLIETPGVVVACPHCGVHLSIPAPETSEVLNDIESRLSPELIPDPPSTLDTPPGAGRLSVEISPMEVAQLSEPAIEGDTAVAEPPSSEVAPTETGEVDTGDIELNFGALGGWSPNVTDEPPTEAAGASDIFSGSGGDTLEHEVEFGWHSAPNLSLSKDEPTPALTPSVPEPDVSQPALFTSPLMGWASPSSPVSSDEHATSEQSPAPFPSFAETPVHAAVSATPLSGLVSAGAWDFMQRRQPDAPPPAAAVPTVNFVPPANSFASEALPADGPANTESPTGAFDAAQFENAASNISQPSTVSGDEFALSTSQQFHFGALPAAMFAGADSPTPDSAAASTDAVTSAITGDSPLGLKPVATYSADAVEARQRQLVMLLLLVGSYASAVTIVLSYLFFFVKAHPLESLPDIKVPTRKGGEVALTYYAPKNDLAPGHVMRLGQSERFGSVKVTPVKVTRGIVKFEHGRQKGAEARQPTEPLLKLWLKFENVSRDQTFAPLDAVLMFKRKTKSFGETVYANNFLGASADRKQGGTLLYVYDHPVYSEFVMADQKLDEQVSPGTSWLTFIPSEEEAVQLSGELVWRFHFRKGYHSKSRNGVTTLVDVEFSSKDITDESGAS